MIVWIALAVALVALVLALLALRGAANAIAIATAPPTEKRVAVDPRYRTFNDA